MISCDRGKIHIDGTGECILAEMSLVISECRKIIADSFGEDFAKYLMKKVFDLSNLSDEEIEKKVSDIEKTKNDAKKHFAKYKKGQKFQVEIAEVHTHYTDDGNPYNLYRIKGFNTMVFDDYGLNRLIGLAKGDE